MSKQELVALMQDQEKINDRKRQCRVLAEALCVTMNLQLEARNLVLLLKQVESKTNYEAMIGWVYGYLDELDGLSNEEQLAYLQNQLASSLSEQLF